MTFHLSIEFVLPIFQATTHHGASMKKLACRAIVISVIEVADIGKGILSKRLETAEIAAINSPTIS
jgi:hypothetical protein